MNRELNKLANELELTEPQLLKLARDVSRNQELASVGSLSREEKGRLVEFLESCKAYREAEQGVLVA